MKKHFYILFPVLLFSSVSFGQLSFQQLNTQSTQDLLGISFADSSTGYACGMAGTVLKTTDGGSSWSKLTTGTSEKLWDIKVVPNSGGQKLIAVGDNNTVIKSTDGGSSWKAQTIPFQSGSFVFGVQCLDSLNFYACGGDYSTFSGAVLKTTDGGANWTKSAVSGSIFLDKIFMLPSGQGFSVGTNSSFSDGSVQKSTGGSFSTVKTSNSIITDLWCHSASRITAVGLGGQILVSTDGGSNWTNNSFNSEDLYCVRFADANHGFACGGSPSGAIILSTSNGGSSWSSHAFTFSGSFQSISLAGNKLFIAGDAGTVIKTTLPPISGKEELNNNKARISIYPNPASGRLFIDNPDMLEGLQIRLFDNTGRVAGDFPVGINNEGPDVSMLAKGVYTYSINKGNEQIGLGKLVLVY